MFWSSTRKTNTRRLADAVGGTHIALGSRAGRLNPFDLPSTAPAGTPTPSAAGGSGTAEGDPLTRRALFLHTLLGVLLGGPLDPATTAVADRAILAAYQQAGITS